MKGTLDTLNEKVDNLNEKVDKFNDTVDKLNDKVDKGFLEINKSLQKHNKGFLEINETLYHLTTMTEGSLSGHEEAIEFLCEGDRPSEQGW